MSIISFQALSALRHSKFLTKNLSVVFRHTVRSASKTAAIPGIAGLGGKVGHKADSKVTVGQDYAIPVETDVERLVTHVCGTNLLKEGGEDVKLKPDSEYPDWLWNLQLGVKPHFSQLSPDSLEYWKQIRKIYDAEQMRIKKRMRF